MEEKISHLQRQQMENRLKKLEVEQARAQALIDNNRKRMRELDGLRRVKQSERDDKHRWRNW